LKHLSEIVHASLYSPHTILKLIQNSADGLAKTWSGCTWWTSLDNTGANTHTSQLWHFLSFENSLGDCDSKFDHGKHPARCWQAAALDKLNRQSRATLERTAKRCAAVRIRPCFHNALGGIEFNLVAGILQTCFPECCTIQPDFDNTVFCLWSSEVSCRYTCIIIDWNQSTKAMELTGYLHTGATACEIRAGGGIALGLSPWVRWRHSWGRQSRLQTTVWDEVSWRPCVVRTRSWCISPYASTGHFGRTSPLTHPQYVTCKVLSMHQSSPSFHHRI
jgi:hypothetical protein